jgi:hypothetical protein
MKIHLPQPMEKWSPELRIDEVQDGNIYMRDSPVLNIDVYRVLRMFEVTDPAIAHAIKKLLCAGQRGYKTQVKDVHEAIESLRRFLDMEDEDGNDIR